MTKSDNDLITIVHSTDDLRNLIMQHPDMPLLIMAGENSNTGDYPYMVCTAVTAEAGEYLSCWQEFDEESIYTNREEFERVLTDCVGDSRVFDTESEFDAAVQAELKKHDKYWKPCIILRVDN